MSSRGSGGRTNGSLPQTKICQFKLVLLGDMAVGKSSLVLRFVKGQFDEFQETTIGGEDAGWGVGGGGGRDRRGRRLLIWFVVDRRERF